MFFYSPKGESIQLLRLDEPTQLEAVELIFGFVPPVRFHRKHRKLRNAAGRR
jgi:hypothetical protein